MKRKRKPTVPAVKGLGPMLLGTGPALINSWSAEERRASLDHRLFRRKFGRSFWYSNPHIWQNDRGWQTHGIRKKRRFKGKWKARERARREAIRNGGFIEVVLKGQAVYTAYEQFLRGRIPADEKGLFNTAKETGQTSESMKALFSNRNISVKYRVKKDDESRMWFKLAVG